MGSRVKKYRMKPIPAAFSEVRFKVTINGQSAEIVGTVAEA